MRKNEKKENNNNFFKRTKISFNFLYTYFFFNQIVIF